MAWMAPIIAAAAQRREEEEVIALMQQEHGMDWEYKVMQAMIFASREKVQAVLEQEARAGWDRAATLSDGRIVLRRSMSARQQDALLPEGVNPYQTNASQTTAVVLGLVFLLTLGMVVFTLLLVLAAR